MANGRATCCSLALVWLSWPMPRLRLRLRLSLSARRLLGSARLCGATYSPASRASERASECPVGERAEKVSTTGGDSAHALVRLLSDSFGRPAVQWTELASGRDGTHTNSLQAFSSSSSLAQRSARHLLRDTANEILARSLAAQNPIGAPPPHPARLSGTF